MLSSVLCIQSHVCAQGHTLWECEIYQHRFTDAQRQNGFMTQTD